MNKFFKYNAAVALSMLMLASCAEDKGNYEYSDKEIITISGIPEQIAVLANAENKAKEMLLNVKNETEKEGEKTLLECEQSAKLLVEKRISEAKQECSRLKEISDKKNKECAEIVLKKIFV